MGLHNELPVYKASYDLLLEIFQFTKDFSKDFKYTVGESLKNETIKLLTLIFRANSRTVRQRIEYLEKLETIKSSEEEINGIRLVVSSEDNRVQIFFPGIPEEEVRKELKSNGFRWAPSIGAWMRNISNHSIYIAKQILNNLKTQV